MNKKSIGERIVELYGEDYLNKIWSDKNTESPFDIRKGVEKIWLKCQNDSTHPDYDLTVSNFKVSHNCPYCVGKRVCYTNSLGYKYPESLDIWSEKNEISPYEIVPGSKSEAWWKCEYGIHDDYKRMISRTVTYKFRCPTCGRKNQYNPSGPDHPNWKGGISTKAQLEIKSPKYNEWRDKVYERDDYTCQCCGQRGGRLTAHHLHDYAHHEDLRFEVDNGITLCFDCHDSTVSGSFHNRYGTHEKTPQELEKYINERRIELGIYLPFSIDEYMKGNILTADQAKRAKLFYGKMSFIPYCGIRPVPDDEVMVTDSKFVKIKPKFRVEEE